MKIVKKGSGRRKERENRKGNRRGERKKMIKEKKERESFTSHQHYNTSMSPTSLSDAYDGSS